MRRLSALGLELQGISKIYYKGSKRIFKGLGFGDSGLRVWGLQDFGLDTSRALQGGGEGLVILGFGLRPRGFGLLKLERSP